MKKELKFDGATTGGTKYCITAFSEGKDTPIKVMSFRIAFKFTELEQRGETRQSMERLKVRMTRKMSELVKASEVVDNRRMITAISLPDVFSTEPGKMHQMAINVSCALNEPMCFDIAIPSISLILNYLEEFGREEGERLNLGCECLKRAEKAENQGYAVFDLQWNEKFRSEVLKECADYVGVSPEALRYSLKQRKAHNGYYVVNLDEEWHKEDYRSENRKARGTIKSGEAKRSIGIVALSVDDGREIGRWRSIQEASKGIGISSVSLQKWIKSDRVFNYNGVECKLLKLN